MQEIDMKQQVKHTVDLNGFDNYDINSSRPQNTESGKPEIKNIGEILQDENNSIICNNISNAR